MDENGFYAQVLYPNAVGIGGQVLANDVKDPVLRQMCVEIYNDAMGELQEWSENRFIPMPVMPAWERRRLRPRGRAHRRPWASAAST